jgi:hypothetical protein
MSFELDIVRQALPLLLDTILYLQRHEGTGYNTRKKSPYV